MSGVVRMEDNIVYGSTANTIPSYFRANNGSFGEDFSIKIRNNNLINFFRDPFGNNTPNENPSGAGNATVQFPALVGGNTDQVCLSSLANCTTTGGIGNFINNATGQQTSGNFNIQARAGTR